MESQSYTDPDEFYNFIVQRFQDESTYYLLIDEIQNVSKFEFVINSFRSTHNTSIFITSSNSKLLSGELATHLSGRTISFRMMPFTYREFLELKGKRTDKETLQEYMEWGGFPLVCSTTDITKREMILSNLYDSVVLKDIIMRNKISSTHALNKILDDCIANSSSTFSAAQVANFLKQSRLKISTPTIYEYIRYIEEAGIMDKVERYDIRGKKILAFEEKAYVCDLGLFHLKKNKVKDEYSLIIETLIYNEFIARGYHVYIGKTFKGEVDFIVEKEQRKMYMQAAYLLHSQETIDREFGAFKDIKDNYPKYVVSYDDITIKNQDGIVHLSLLDFLMDEKLFM